MFTLLFTFGPSNWIWFFALPETLFSHTNLDISKTKKSIWGLHKTNIKKIVLLVLRRHYFIISLIFDPSTCLKLYFHIKIGRDQKRKNLLEAYIKLISINVSIWSFDLHYFLIFLIFCLLTWIWSFALPKTLFSYIN